MATVQVRPSNAAGPNLIDVLIQLQVRCIHELRDAEVDAGGGGFRVTAEASSTELRQRIVEVINDEFSRYRREGWPEPAEWFELS